MIVNQHSYTVARFRKRLTKVFEIVAEGAEVIVRHYKSPVCKLRAHQGDKELERPSIESAELLKGDLFDLAKRHDALNVKHRAKKRGGGFHSYIAVIEFL